ncbi:hypothetical protein LRAMOSA11161 [Lichtheimia ramosa]|uniref:Cytochrome b561 domain-containing protein n=1 Tax=Lichtheimia ramosa TaxID=688394 RepID=A0A077WTN1_9FUNG|nr:hypothetical protein LRAMOSA11161 [Lichtheimia ramosa]
MTTEDSPLLNHNVMKTHSRESLKDKASAIVLNAGLLLFIGLVISVLVRVPFNLFTYHPIFMILFITCCTEGIVLLQPTRTTQEKKRGLRHHATAQVIGYTSAIVGFTAIVYNKVVSDKEHFTSLHAQLGLTLFCYLFCQSLFGLLIAYVPSLIFGNVASAKRLWKFHRMTGYVLLVLVWLTAQLGVRADYMISNLWSEKLMWLHWVALGLVTIGVVARIRLWKWGITSSPP